MTTPSDAFPYLTTAATSLVDTLAVVEPLHRAVVIMFEPGDAERHVLYSNGAAADLVPVLRAVLERIEAGRLRMPVTDAVRWVEFDAKEIG